MHSLVAESGLNSKEFKRKKDSPIFGAKTEVEKYIRKSGMLTEQSELLRLDVMEDTADEPRLIEGIKNLIS